MKNIFLTLALLLTVSFTFADSNSKNLDTVNKGWVCVVVHTSCGIVGSVCGYSVADLIDNAIALDAWQCPKK